LKSNMPVHDIPRWAIVTSLVTVGITLLLDGWILERMPPEGTQFGDLYYLFLSIGYLPTWIAFCLVFTFATHRDHRLQRRESAIAIALTAAGSGIIAAILKVLVRRLDPREMAEGSWQLAPWEGQWWDGTDLCFPSEHAAVAWGAAIAISRRWPRAAPLMLLLAAGCASGRVLARAHNPSDVMASLVVAIVVSWAIERCFGDPVSQMAVAKQKPAS